MEWIPLLYQYKNNERSQTNEIWKDHHPSLQINRPYEIAIGWDYSIVQFTTKYETTYVKIWDKFCILSARVSLSLISSFQSINACSIPFSVSLNMPQDTSTLFNLTTLYMVLLICAFSSFLLRSGTRLWRRPRPTGLHNASTRVAPTTTWAKTWTTSTARTSGVRRLSCFGAVSTRGLTKRCTTTTVVTATVAARTSVPTFRYVIDVVCSVCTN